MAVPDGYWTVPSTATVSDWSNPTWRGTGRAVSVALAPGTAVQFTKNYTVDSLDTPMTLTAATVAALGEEKVAQLGKAWRVVALADDEKVLKAERTYSYEQTMCEDDPTVHCDGHAIDSLG